MNNFVERFMSTIQLNKVAGYWKTSDLFMSCDHFEMPAFCQNRPKASI